MSDSAYLVHYGILGQRKGIRRYQNSDGTLTEAGKERYRKQLSGALQSRSKRKIDKVRKSGEYKKAVNSLTDEYKSLSKKGRDASKRYGDELNKAYRDREFIDRLIDKERKEGLWDSTTDDRTIKKFIEEEYDPDELFDNYRKMYPDRASKGAQAYEDKMRVYNRQKEITRKAASEMLGEYAEVPVKLTASHKETADSVLGMYLSYDLEKAYGYYGR